MPLFAWIDKYLITNKSKYKQREKANCGIKSVLKEGRSGNIRQFEKNNIEERGYNGSLIKRMTELLQNYRVLLCKSTLYSKLSNDLIHIFLAVSGQNLQNS